MDIRNYLKLNRGIKAREFATQVSTSLGYLRLIGYGVRKPSADISIRIEYASQGAVTAAKLRPDLPWPQLKPRNEQAADRTNDPPLMPAPNRESHHASHAENPMHT